MLRPRLLLSLLLLLVVPTLLAVSPTASAKKPKRADASLAHPASQWDHGRKNGVDARNDHHPVPADPGPDPAACTVTLAGPTNVVRSKGRPRVEEFEFTSPDPLAAHFLRLDNGGSQDEMRPVTSARVYWNDRLEIGPREFNRRVRTIVHSVEAQEQNRVDFVVAGKPKSGLAFSVIAVDDVPPTIVDVLPPDGSIVSEPEVSLVVTLDDALSGAASLSCAGVDATPVGQRFACTVPLSEGSNSIELIATDSCGNESSEVVTIVFDPPPVVMITSPSDGDRFITGPVTVTGTVDDATATVTVNGVPASGATNFSASVPVRKGENTLVAVARDASGGEGSDSVEITVLAGMAGPAVRILSPADGFLVGGPRPASPYALTVQGSVLAEGGSDAAARPGVVVNGLAASVAASPGPGPLCTTLGVCKWGFSASLVLDMADNPQMIEAVATDRFGQTDSDTISGDVDECVKSGADGYAIVGAETGQANRCHEIDGCSAPFSDSFRDDPTGGTLGRHSTAFGKDVLTTDFDPHGLAPRDDLPCNHHDVCYQTCGSDKLTCDNAMYRDMLDVCQSAYPELICPYLPNAIKCAAWGAERDRCYAWAAIYRDALFADKWVDDRFGEKQDAFCW